MTTSHQKETHSMSKRCFFKIVIGLKCSCSHRGMANLIGCVYGHLCLRTLESTDSRSLRTQRVYGLKESTDSKSLRTQGVYGLESFRTRRWCPRTPLSLAAWHCASDEVRRCIAHLEVKISEACIRKVCLKAN